MVKDHPVKSTLYVLDSALGNESVTTVAAKIGDSPKIKLQSSSFNRVRRVEIQITSAANQLPAAAGVVKLESENLTQTEILDPSARGSVFFKDVPSGTAKVTVEYGDGKSTSQDIEISTERKTPVLTVKIPVAGEIETIQAAAASSESKGTGTSTARKPTFSYGTAFVGMLLLAALLYALYSILKKRGATVEGALQQLGVDVAQGTQAAGAGQPAGAAVDSGICPFCGGKKDPVTGACACSVGVGGPNSPGAATGPRVIVTQGAHMGGIFPLGSEALTMGRAETNTIALPDDNTASRRHARISLANGEYTIFDEGSSNGTFVNGVKVTEQVLHAGDEIQVGSTKLRFEA
jgi:hypothetical protein